MALRKKRILPQHPAATDLRSKIQQSIKVFRQVLCFPKRAVNKRSLLIPNDNLLDPSKHSRDFTINSATRRDNSHVAPKTYDQRFDC
jgi:hypothetical protein